MTDLRLTVTFEEHEARFLGGLVQSAMNMRLTEDQRDAANAIANKFIVVAGLKVDEVFGELGEEAGNRLAAEHMALHPDIEEVHLLWPR